jgi:hypothetical protein
VAPLTARTVTSTLFSAPSTARSNHIKSVFDKSCIYLVSASTFASQRSHRPTQTDPITPSTSSVVRLIAGKSRRIRIYEERACNPCRISTYEKTGEGPPPSGIASPGCLSSRSGQAGPWFLIHYPLVPGYRCANTRKVTESRLLLLGGTPGNISAPLVSNVQRADIGFGIRRLPNPVASRSRASSVSHEQGLGPTF